MSILKDRSLKEYLKTSNFISQKLIKLSTWCINKGVSLVIEKCVREDILIMAFVKGIDHDFKTLLFFKKFNLRDGNIEDELVKAGHSIMDNFEFWKAKSSKPKHMLLCSKHNHIKIRYNRGIMVLKNNEMVCIMDRVKE
jgi:hypothetical protein